MIDQEKRFDDFLDDLEKKGWITTRIDDEGEERVELTEDSRKLLSILKKYPPLRLEDLADVDSGDGAEK